MTVTHQITDDLLTAYAAGALPEAFDLVVATHVSLSDDVRARLGAVEAVGGAILESQAPTAMASGSLAATLELIKAGAESAQAETERKPCAILPEPVQSYVGGGFDDVRWRPVGGGVKQAILHEDDHGSVRLLSIPGGVEVPDHSHTGLELTLVLQGAFADGQDTFARGDLEIADDDLEHTPTAVAGQDCICLAATEGPLKFSGLLPRLVQPFVRI